MRVRYKSGCVWLDGKTWRFRAGSGSKSIRIGTTAEYKTKSQALKAAQHLVAEANEQTNISVATIGDVISRYKREELPRVRKCTAHAYESWLDLHIYPKWSEVRTDKFNAYEFKLWLEGLTLSGKSRAEIKGMMGRLFRCAMLWGYAHKTENPMKLFRLWDVRRKSKPRILTVAEFQKLIANLEEPFRTMACIAQFQALRISELLALKWGDIDWFEKTVSIQRSLVLGDVNAPKTLASEAVRPLEDGELEMLKNHRQSAGVRMNAFNKLGSKTHIQRADGFTKDTDYIFASPHSGGDLPYHYTSVIWKLQLACKAAGIPKIGTHTFRHTARAWAGELGIPLSVIKDMHRHENIATTMNVYGGTVPEALREAHVKLVKMVVG
jgi:integrase